MKRKVQSVSLFLFLSLTTATAFSQEMPKFSSDTEKEAWIKANPEAYARETQRLEGQVLVSGQAAATEETVATRPTGFNPTGNPATYEAEKKEWINNNPEAYSNSIGKADNYSKVDLPGFPEYINTGNPELDNANYQKAKQDWISRNQELYNSQFTISTETKEQDKH